MRMDTGLNDFLEKREISLDIVGTSDGLSTNETRRNLKDVIQHLLDHDLREKPFFFVTGPSQCNELVNTPKENESFTSIDNSTIAPSEEKSVIGSPLKLQEIANLSLESHRTSPLLGVSKKQRLVPLTLKYGRRLLNKFIAAKVFGPPKIPMLVVLCDAEDKNKTVLIGAHKEVKDGKLLVKVFSVRSNIMNTSMLEEYIQKEGTGKGCHVVSQYQILDKRDGLGNLVLQVQWFDPLGQAKLTKLQAAEFYLQATVVPGSEQSPVFDLFCQLQRIQGFVESAKTGELPEVLSLTEVNVVSLLGDLLQKVKASNLGQQRVVKDHRQASSRSGMLSGAAKHLSLDSGYESDFTDELWAIISSSSHYTEMVKSLNLIFCELRRGGIKAFIHQDNETTLAKLVRQSYSGMASFPSLTGQLPLQLMAEIGLEKMRKHYRSIFINNKLCTSEQWSSFFHALTPTFDDVMNIEELSLNLLCALYDIISKLHHCLEVVSVIDAFTENQPLASFTLAVMNYYKNEKLNSSHNFSFQMTALQAAPELKRVPLSFLRRETITEGVSTVECLMSEAPEDLNVSVSSVSSDLSMDAGIPKEFVIFKTEEDLHCLCTV